MICSSDKRFFMGYPHVYHEDITHIEVFQSAGIRFEFANRLKEDVPDSQVLLGDMAKADDQGNDKYISVESTDTYPINEVFQQLFLLPVVLLIHHLRVTLLVLLYEKVTVVKKV